MFIFSRSLKLVLKTKRLTHRQRFDVVTTWWIFYWKEELQFLRHYFIIILHMPNRHCLPLNQIWVRLHNCTQKTIWRITFLSTDTNVWHSETKSTSSSFTMNDRQKSEKSGWATTSGGTKQHGYPASIHSSHNRQKVQKINPGILGCDWLFAPLPRCDWLASLASCREHRASHVTHREGGPGVLKSKVWMCLNTSLISLW